MESLMSLLIISILALGIFCLIYWLFFEWGIDKLKHPEEWKDSGKAGERILYNTLVQENAIPENQIFRNVYIPTDENTTSEIDLLVVSKKGLFVFECKNYGGTIYGNAQSPKWVQYIGREKNYFYSPLMQNRNHVKNLHLFLASRGIDVPIIPIFARITRGKWKIKNLGDDDYILNVNCDFKSLYKNLPDSENIAKHFNVIMDTFAKLSRPDNSIREKHIEDIERQKHI